MNYRELQWRQILKRDYVLKKEFRAVELNNALLNSDLEALRTSLDYSNLDHWERENYQLKEELARLEAFANEQYILIQSQENTIQEQKGTIQDLTTRLNQKNNLLTKKNTLLQRLLRQKQEQLNHAN